MQPKLPFWCQFNVVIVQADSFTCPLVFYHKTTKNAEMQYFFFFCGFEITVGVGGEVHDSDF